MDCLGERLALGHRRGAGVVDAVGAGARRFAERVVGWAADSVVKGEC